jgi:purine-binding chemotaxis protein CheW
MMTELVDADLYPAIPILVFRLSEQLYALPLNCVNQIVDMVMITRLPDVPPPIQGAINVHGRLTVVIDMRQRLGLPAKEYEAHTPLLLVELTGRPVALAVDHVLGVHEVAAADLEVPDSFLPASLTPRPRFITSLGKIESGLVVLLDPSQMLLADEEAPLDDALRTGPAV